MTKGANLPQVVAAQRAKDEAAAKKANAEAAKVKPDAGLVTARLTRGAYTRTMGYLEAGIHTLPKDEVPSSAEILAEGPPAEKAEAAE